MKRLWLLALIVLSVAACKNDPQTGNGQANQIATGSAVPPETPPDRFETRLLLTNYWVFEFFVMEDPTRNQENRGRWFRFYPDGTYDGGQWQEAFDHGTWFLREGDEYTLLYTDSEVDDNLDAEWEMQSFGRDNEAMSWVKTRNFGNGEMAMCKIINMLSMPTKKQFLME